MFGRDVTLIDLREMISYTDYFIVTSGETERQVRRIFEDVIERMREGTGLSPGDTTRGRRGSASTSWTWSSMFSLTRLATTTA